jgi:guanylate kinase
MNPSELTSLGALAVSAIALIVLPIAFKRQGQRQVRELQEREQIKADALRDAAMVIDNSVSWEKINRALAATITEERAANRERLAELRDEFNAETARQKKLTDNDLDRAKAEIARLANQIRQLEDRVAEQTRRLESQLTAQRQQQQLKDRS